MLADGDIADAAGAAQLMQSGETAAVGELAVHDPPRQFLLHLRPLDIV